MFIPDFDTDTRDTLPSLDPDLFSMNQFLNDGLPIISQALTRIIANRINHRSGRQGTLLGDVAQVRFSIRGCPDNSRQTGRLSLHFHLIPAPAEEASISAPARARCWRRWHRLSPGPASAICNGWYWKMMLLSSLP